MICHIQMFLAGYTMESYSVMIFECGVCCYLLLAIANMAKLGMVIMLNVAVPSWLTRSSIGLSKVEFIKIL